VFSCFNVQVFPDIINIFTSLIQGVNKLDNINSSNQNTGTMLKDPQNYTRIRRKF
jgi:hypothetical protein